MTASVAQWSQLCAMVAVFLCLSACQPPISSPGSGTGAIEFDFPADRGLYSDIMFWRISGVGPGPEIKQLVTVNQTRLVWPELRVGTWTITVEGLDNREYVAFSDTQTIQITDGDNNAVFTLRMIDGRPLNRWTFDDPSATGLLRDTMRRLPLTMSAIRMVGAGPAPHFQSQNILVDGPGYLNFPSPGVTAAVNGGGVDLGPYNFGDRFSVSMWVKPQPDNTYVERKRVLLSNQSAASLPVAGVSQGSGFTISLNTWNGATEDGLVSVETANGSSRQVVTSTGPLKPNGWQLLTVTFDRAAGQTQIFIMGGLNASGPIVGDFASSGQNARLGGLPVGNGGDPGYFFAGQMDDVRIWAGVFGGTALVSREYFAGGDGSQGSPFLVADAEQFNKIRFFNHEHFRQTADFSFADKPWLSSAPSVSFVPVGNNLFGGGNFFGNYDGDGHRISGLYVSNTAPNLAYSVDPTNLGPAGLFGVAKGASLRKLTLAAPQVVSTMQTGGLVGLAALDGSKMTTIEDCKVEGGSVVGQAGGGGTGYETGGLAGRVEGSLVNKSLSTATVNGLDRVGGLVGASATGSELRACGAVSTVNGNTELGGLAGCSEGLVYGCRFGGYLYGGAGNYIGGLVGYLGAGSILGGSAIASVSGGSFVGGLVGYGQAGAGPIHQSYALANIQASGTTAGGLVGHCAVAVYDSWAKGVVQGGTTIGGLVGNLLNGGQLDRCVAGVYVTGASVHGVAGNTQAGSFVNNVYWDGSVSGSTTPVPGTATVTGGGYGHTLQAGQKSSFPGLVFAGAGGPWVIQEGKTYPYLAWQGDTDLPILPLGGLGLYISFIYPWDPITWFSGPGTVSKTTTGITVVATAGYVSYDWYLNGVYVATGGTYNETINSAQIAAAGGLSIGVNRLTLVVQIAGGQKYSCTVPFNVTN